MRHRNLALLYYATGLGLGWIILFLRNMAITRRRDPTPRKVQSEEQKTNKEVQIWISGFIGVAYLACYLSRNGTYAIFVTVFSVLVILHIVTDARAQPDSKTDE